MKKAVLALEDGTIFEGYSIGADGETTAEVVFNTSMTGYQEVLTDPSYKGQIVTMTYTEQGNYGTNDADVESRQPWVEGFVVREASPVASSWRAETTLVDYLKRHNIVAIAGIDTRALTRIIRSEGAMQAALSTIDLDPTSLVTKAKNSDGLVGRDLVKEVTCDAPYHWTERLWDLEDGYAVGALKAPHGTEKPFKVVAMDYGVKLNILRNLVEAGCDVTVVPASTPADKVLEMDPDGIFLSNGPGDPAAVNYAIENLKKLVGKKPIFGICIGHQLLSLALGARTFKLKFGHRGANQPVMDMTTGKVEITSQNHGFAVDMDSVKDAAMVTHVNLNDRTVEGISHEAHRAFSVQYHPEASPGPHDSAYLFMRFMDLMAGEGTASGGR